jgi:hypothetical protein
LEEEMSYPKASIIILNWNGLEDTIECLESLKKITYPNYEVIVVDNGSTGNDTQVIKEKFGDYIYLIQNDKNYGYTGGNNIGIRYALANYQPDYFLILNNDTVVAPDFLTELVRVSETDADIGIAGPKIYYHHFPGRIQSVGALVNMQKGRASLIGCNEIDTGQYDTEQDVDYVEGCCLLVKRELIHKVGLLDESYFCYWDEADYCIRAKKAGYKIVYAPMAKVWHKGGISGKISTLRCYYMARNNFKFVRRHGTRWQYCSFLIWFFGYYFWLATVYYLLLCRSLNLVTSFYRGTKDGLSGSDDGAKLYTRD